MKTDEFFNKVGGDFEDVLKRLLNEDMIKKFVHRFPSDPSFKALEKAFFENDTEAAFLAAHTLKGTAANLGLENLSKEASFLTEILRGAQSLPEKKYFEQTKKEWERTLSLIAELD